MTLAGAAGNQLIQLITGQLAGMPTVSASVLHASPDGTQVLAPRRSRRSRSVSRWPTPRGDTGPAGGGAAAPPPAGSRVTQPASV
jgi:hypothetical protein